jgi:hypothetical protein
MMCQYRCLSSCSTVLCVVTLLSLAVTQSLGSSLPPKLHEQPLPTVDSPARVKYPHNVVGLQDITYKTVPGFRPLKLDLYLPRDSAMRRPGVIWIHGGG